MIKYTRTYETLPRGLSKMLNKLEPSITKSIPNYSGKQPRYIIAYNGDNQPRGILIWCYRCARRFGLHNMPFLAVMDTAVHHRGYGDLSEKGYVHNRVNHSAKLYVDGKAYTNGIESVWSLVKRGFYGTFHKFTLEHLQRYVDEFDFRWNEGNCKVPTDERIDSLVCGCWGKTLNYRMLVA